MFYIVFIKRPCKQLITSQKQRVCLSFRILSWKYVPDTLKFSCLNLFRYCLDLLLVHACIIFLAANAHPAHYISTFGGRDRQGTEKRQRGGHFRRNYAEAQHVSRLTQGAGQIFYLFYRGRAFLVSAGR